MNRTSWTTFMFICVLSACGINCGDDEKHNKLSEIPNPYTGHSESFKGCNSTGKSLCVLESGEVWIECHEFVGPRKSLKWLCLKLNPNDAPPDKWIVEKSDFEQYVPGQVITVENYPHIFIDNADGKIWIEKDSTP